MPEATNPNPNIRNIINELFVQCGGAIRRENFVLGDNMREDIRALVRATAGSQQMLQIIHDNFDTFNTSRTGVYDRESLTVYDPIITAVRGMETIDYGYLRGFVPTLPQTLQGFISTQQTQNLDSGNRIGGPPPPPAQTYPTREVSRLGQEYLELITSTTSPYEAGTIKSGEVGNTFIRNFLIANRNNEQVNRIKRELRDFDRWLTQNDNNTNWWWEWNATRNCYEINEVILNRMRRTSFRDNPLFVQALANLVHYRRGNAWHTPQLPANGLGNQPSQLTQYLTFLNNVPSMEWGNSFCPNELESIGLNSSNTTISAIHSELNTFSFTADRLIRGNFRDVNLPTVQGRIADVVNGENLRSLDQQQKNLITAILIRIFQRQVDIDYRRFHSGEGPAYSY